MIAPNPDVAGNPLSAESAKGNPCNFLRVLSPERTWCARKKCGPSVVFCFSFQIVKHVK